MAGTRLVTAVLAVLAVLVGGCATVDPAPARPSTAPATTAPTGSRLPATTIPAGFLLHERAAVNVIDDFRYAPECFGRPVMRRSLFRSVGTPDVGITQSLFVYGDEKAAASVMRSIRSILAVCSGFVGARVLARPASPPWGDEAATITLALPADGANEHTGAPVRYDVVRVGRAIVEVEGYPDARQVDVDARAVVGRLCHYDADCGPRAPLPAALPELADGGEAWVAVLAVLAATDPRPMPGESIAAAGELGYHATVVPRGCDVGPVPADPYTAVYFATQVDAEAFAAALPAPPVTVARVRTYCL